MMEVKIQETRKKTVQNGTRKIKKMRRVKKSEGRRKNQPNKKRRVSASSTILLNHAELNQYRNSWREATMPVASEPRPCNVP